MKFRITKEDGLYSAEYRSGFLWWYVSNSVSRDIEETRKACKLFMESRGKPNVVESFKL